MTIDLCEIKQGVPGALTPTMGSFLFENCVVCLSKKNHNHSGTKFYINGDTEIEATLTWDNIYNEELERTYTEQTTATNYGAVCLAILLALKLTNYTILSQAVIGTGFDYWLAPKGGILFQGAARLEISGIFNNPNEINNRYNVKIEQTNKSDNTKLPAYIGIVEFSKPKAKFGLKK